MSDPHAPGAASSAFDPDAASLAAGLYGLDLDPLQAAVQIIPMPWEATASYGRGTRHGPAAVARASHQVDLDDPDFGPVWKEGVGLLDLAGPVERAAERVEADAMAVIESGGRRPELAARVDRVAEELHLNVQAQAARILAEGRIPAVLGGDHSTPYGLHKAICRAHPGVGFLHLDAHADLRPAFLGFKHSHASIFHNTLGLPGAGRLVGVGWRDMGEVERRRIAEDERIRPFFDHDIGRELAGGGAWRDIAERIVESLPPLVHISVDIDGLDPSLCPHTGTPVPGGLSFRDLQVLLRLVAERRRVVGFDLVEVNPGPWPLPEGARDGIDAIVGARVLYKLAGCALRSQGRV